jgi:uncharacterized protein (DUF2237 family)
MGSHTVCSIVSPEFLDFSLLAGTWLEAYRAGCAPAVVLAATHATALEVVPIEALVAHAFQPHLVE